MALAIILILAVGVVWATAALARAGTQQQPGSRSRSIDQDLVEARLTRIEEAIDAMSLQVERLTEHQRTLLQSREPSLQQDDNYRTEPPR